MGLVQKSMEGVRIRLVRLKGDEPNVFQTHFMYADGRAGRGAQIRTVAKESGFQLPIDRRQG